MVDMSMSDDNLTEGQAVFLQPGDYFRMLSPGSTTRASCVTSSPRMVQLQRSGPTGKVSRIIPSF